MRSDVSSFFHRSTLTLLLGHDGGTRTNFSEILPSSFESIPSRTAGACRGMLVPLSVEHQRCRSSGWPFSEIQPSRTTTPMLIETLETSFRQLRRSPLPAASTGRLLALQILPYAHLNTCVPCHAFLAGDLNEPCDVSPHHQVHSSYPPVHFCCYCYCCCCCCCLPSRFANLVD